MSTKYYFIRREINENKPDEDLKSYRNFQQIKKLFNLPYWIMMISVIVSLIAILIIMFSPIKDNWLLIPMIIIIMISIFQENISEKIIYNYEKRQAEIDNKLKKYEDYIKNVIVRLKEYDITDDKSLKPLKNECAEILHNFKEKYSLANRKISEMFILVPLGAIVSNIMDKDADFSLGLWVAILCGIFFLGFIQLVKFIDYLMSGIAKDKYLFNILCDLNYENNKWIIETVNDERVSSHQCI